MSGYVLLVAGSKEIEDLGIIAPRQETRMRDTRMGRQEIVRPEDRPVMGFVLETC